MTADPENGNDPEDAHDAEDPSARCERLLAVIKSHAAQLAEFFDTVQIFVTKFDGDDDTTYSYQYGVGNAYARYGHVRDWLLGQDAITRDRAVRPSAD